MSEYQTLFPPLDLDLRACLTKKLADYNGRVETFKAQVSAIDMSKLERVYRISPPNRMNCCKILILAAVMKSGLDQSVDVNELFEDFYKKLNGKLDISLFNEAVAVISGYLDKSIPCE